MNHFINLLMILLLFKSFVFDLVELEAQVSQFCSKDELKYMQKFLDENDYHDSISNSKNFIGYVGKEGTILQYKNSHVVKFWEFNWQNERNDRFNKIIDEIKNLQIFTHETYILHQSLNCQYFTENEEIFIFSFTPFMPFDLQKMIALSQKNLNDHLIFALDRALKIIIAVAKIHHNGYIHGDIKPENILVQDIYTPIVSDME